MSYRQSNIKRDKRGFYISECILSRYLSISWIYHSLYITVQTFLLKYTNKENYTTMAQVSFLNTQYKYFFKTGAFHTNFLETSGFLGKDKILFFKLENKISIFFI